MPHKRKLTPEIKDCIIECTECADICLQAIPHILEVEGEHLGRPHISLLNLCSELCRISARTLLMGYEFNSSIARACAAICDACAEECESLEEEFLQRCAAACRRTARACRLVSGKQAKVAYRAKEETRPHVRKPGLSRQPGLH